MIHTGLRNFYQIFISKKGLVNGETEKISAVVGSEIEKQLEKFTIQIRYDDIKSRINLYKTFPLCISVILVLCYLSKFILYLKQ